MSLESLKKNIIYFLSLAEAIDSTGGIDNNPDLKALFKGILNLARNKLPDHSGMFLSLIVDMDDIRIIVRLNDAISSVKHILNLIELEKQAEANMKKISIFDSAFNKIEQASISFRNEDLASTLHNLNTSLELILKDKSGIPSTLRGINTSNIIDILVKHQIGPHRFLSEAKKRVIEIDNKIKHQGYKPSPREAIDAIKIMEELWAQLDGVKFDIPTEVQDKIYSGI